MVSLDIGTRLDKPPSSGPVTVTATVNGASIGQATYDVTTSTPPGSGTVLQFTTQDLNALGDGGDQVTLTITNGTGAQIIVGDVSVVPALSFNVASGQTITDTDQITGPGIVLTGGGTLVLDNAANSYSGATIVEQGKLSIGATGDIGTGTLTLGNGTTLDLTAGFTLTQAIEISGDPAFTVETGQTNVFTGLISNGTSPGTVELTGGGTLELDPTSGPNTYSGGTTIEDGSTLEIGTAGAAGSGAISFSGSGNTLEISGTTIPSNTIDGFASGDTIQIDNFVEQSGVYRNNTLTLSGTNERRQRDRFARYPGLFKTNISIMWHRPRRRCGLRHRLRDQCGLLLPRHADRHQARRGDGRGARDRRRGHDRFGRAAADQMDRAAQL